MTSLYIPGLLLNGEWIPPIRSYGGTVPSLADIIISESSSLFPSHYVSRFDLALGQHFGDAAYVDIALVEKDFEAWYLLFVEPTINADLDSLAARIETVNSHPFGIREARELATQIDELALDEARVLVHDSPRLLVVTDNPRQNWDAELKSRNVIADVMTIEPFRCAGKFVIRLNGEAPSEFEGNVIGVCVFHPVVPNCLVVDWTRPNAIPPLGVVNLKYGGDCTEWDLVQSSSTWQLQPTGPFPLLDSPPFEIVQAPDKSLSIRKSLN